MKNTFTAIALKQSFSFLTVEEALKSDIHLETSNDDIRDQSCTKKEDQQRETHIDLQRYKDKRIYAPDRPAD